MESSFALLQQNVLHRRRWATREEIRLAIVTWIEATYHRRRRRARLRRLTSATNIDEFGFMATEYGSPEIPTVRQLASAQPYWSRCAAELLRTSRCLSVSIVVFGQDAWQSEGSQGVRLEAGEAGDFVAAQGDDE